MKNNNLLTILTSRKIEFEDKKREILKEIDICQKLGYKFQTEVLKDKLDIFGKFQYVIEDILYEYKEEIKINSSSK